ncbi:MAG: hypothetical protein KKD63_05145 [Proteobacteria bacterium]|nr:hypothetical protein [Desulfobulbaceae bacterium]MBU4152247.1 hypothetical protein [Pseudomonadota bacterium]MDP2104674.1 hypothetical protein [Desulfobulbaceae bacterium]
MRRYLKRWFLLIVAVGLLVSCASCVPQSQVNRGYDDTDMFYEALAPYGRWVNHGTYGRVWYPRDVPMGWRPYTDGYWEYSRDYGWVWASDHEWGWAPFHYGRWAFDDWYGWVWVPGREWAPAWVVWRYGDGYAAWAPMPPTALWRPGRGLDRRYFHHERDLGWDCWVGVPERHLHDREMRRHIIGQRDNVWLVKRTSTVVSVTAVNGRIVNQGVPVGYLEKVNGRPVSRVHLHEVDRPDGRGGHRDRDGLRVVRPHFRPQSAVEIRKEAERAEAVLSQQNRLQRERSKDGGLDRQDEPRKAGRFGEKPESSVEARPSEDKESLKAPDREEGKDKKGRTTLREQVRREQGGQSAVQPLAPGDLQQPRSDAVLPVVPQEERRRKEAQPVLLEQQRPARRQLKHDAPRQRLPVNEEQHKAALPEKLKAPLTAPALDSAVSDGQAQSAGSVEPPEPVAAPVSPVIPPPQEPEPPEVPKGDFNSLVIPDQPQGRRPHEVPAQPVPIEVQESVPVDDPKEIVVPVRRGGRRLLRDDQRHEVQGDRMPAEEPDQIRRRQPIEQPPQIPVELPVVPEPPEVPSVRQPPVEAPAPPPAMRRQMELEAQPSGEGAAPERKAKRKKKNGQQEEEEGVIQEGEELQPPQP